MIICHTLFIGVGSGGGGKGACAPHTFQSVGGGKDMFALSAPPLSDPEFRDVPPPILSRSYAVVIEFIRVNRKLLVDPQVIDSLLQVILGKGHLP